MTTGAVRRRILVVSTATHPEPQYMAAALAKAGHDVRLATSASYARDEWPMRLARSLPLGRPGGEVLRRQLPEGLTRGSVIRGGYLGELQSLWTRRVTKDVEGTWRAIDRRNAAFRDRVIGLVRSGRPDDIVVQAHNEVAAPLFEAAGHRTRRVLSFPIAHHRWIARELAREAESNPDWAPFLQSADLLPEAKLRVLDDEVGRADHVVVGSTFVKNTFVAEGVDPDRLTILPLAAPPPSPDGVAPPGLFGANATFKVLFTGQVTQRKGISYLLEAFRALDHPGAELTFLGWAGTEVTARLAGERGVRLLGPVPRPTLMAAQAAADVVVLPSLAEGFPLTAIEAMASGTPVVVSTATFGTDVVTSGRDGFVVGTRDVAGLIQALSTLADTPGLAQQMGERARLRARDFTWPAYEERFLSWFHGWNWTPAPRPPG